MTEANHTPDMKTSLIICMDGRRQLMKDGNVIAEMSAEEARRCPYGDIVYSLQQRAGLKENLDGE